MADNTEGAGEQDKHHEMSAEGVHQVKVFLGHLLGHSITSLVASLVFMRIKQKRGISSEAVSLGEQPLT